MERTNLTRCHKVDSVVPFVTLVNSLHDCISFLFGFLQRLWPVPRASMSHLEAEIYDIAICATHLKELAPRHRTTCAPAVVTGHLVYCAKFGPVSIGCTGPLPKRIVFSRVFAFSTPAQCFKNICKIEFAALICSCFVTKLKRNWFSKTCAFFLDPISWANTHGYRSK